MPAAENGVLPPEAPPAVNKWTPSAAPAVLSDLAAGNGAQAAVSAGYLRFEDL
jgi:hypothetical protein